MSTTGIIYKVKSNEYEFSFTAEEIEQTNIITRSPGNFHMISNHRSVNTKLVSEDINKKKFVIEVEGENYHIAINDELDQMLDKMGFDTTAAKQIKNIKAPMPGLVLEISVAEGQEVKQGDRIIILEAMKMENSIMIHCDASIKKIHVKAGQAVDKGQVLVELH
ncbi:MAG: acetyl-CoA carboxylase biotin carboxyl carrier protein subunit [Chitinophagaceae bacterium]|jgi:acetyl/propionyl-CoA carboxylase alpha subunit|nr:acetyl-CoA carboxylase biotin carboxyl carrier protein subunit [Chitinophagaceae bacterium]